MTALRLRAGLLLLAVISVNASYTVLIPFVPDLEHRVGAGPATIALVFALFAAVKALAQPVGGWWVDRWRADAVACLSLLVAAAGIVVCALATDATTLLLGRAVWGLGEGMVSPALYAGMAALCHRYDVSTSRMMGNFGSAAVAGFLIGPLFAGLATAMGLEALFLLGAAATAVTAVGLLYAVPHVRDPASPPEDAGPAGDADEAREPGPPAEAPRRWWPLVLALGALDMLVSFVYSALEPLVPLHVSTAEGASARSAISVVFVVGLATSGLCMWAFGRYAARVELRTLILIGLGFMGAGLAALATSASLAPVSVVFVVFMIGYALLFVSARRGVVELRAVLTNQGRAFGLFGLISDVGATAGPLVGVVLYETTGRLSFALLGAASWLILLVLVVAGRRRRPAVPEAAAVPVTDAAHGDGSVLIPTGSTVGAPDGRSTGTGEK